MNDVYWCYLSLFLLYVNLMRYLCREEIFFLHVDEKRKEINDIKSNLIHILTETNLKIFKLFKVGATH